jgi:flagellar P-ring protein precursor FlgI
VIRTGTLIAWEGAKQLRPVPMRLSFRTLSVLLLAASLAFGVGAGSAAAKSRIKDIVSFEGVRDNPLIGYGIVVGLNGTGDAMRNAPFT